MRSYRRSINGVEMCLQCMAKAKIVVEEVLPGYQLMIATEGHEDWPKDHYGLVQCNDPDFVWGGAPMLDPLFYLTDEQQEAFSDDDPIWDKTDELFKLVEKMEPSFVCDPIVGYQLVQACKKAGYDEEKHGLKVLCWLVHHMAEKMGQIK